ncbi:MAG TPA: HAMP domain-containing sensor histidine kinase, partial [Euzebyales bacterium]|nr:HAMP domain-containing sensor histidine kinase [Euzebyales bacterium]
GASNASWTRATLRRCAVLRPALIAIPVPLILLAVFSNGAVLSPISVMAVCLAALTAALASRWCSERRMRADLQRHARELDQTKRQILALISHELRTPVTGVVGFSRTLSGRLDDLDHDTLRLFVDAIDEHSNRLSRLIDNVVIASRTPLVDDRGSCQLSRALSEAIARVGLRSHRNDRLRISLDGSLEARIDEEAAVRVLTNLLDNALKFGDPDAQIYVEGSARDGRVLLQVGNSGPAIPLGLQSVLYDPFVQGDPTDTRTADGLGLGLHVVRQLVEAYGGTIDLVDHPQLIVFQISLPLACSGGEPPPHRAVAVGLRNGDAGDAPAADRSGQKLENGGGDDVGVLERHPVRGGRNHLHA